MFRRELKKEKTKSSTEFTATINPHTPTQKIWCNIRRFCGLNPIKKIHCITNIQNQQKTTDQNEIADNFALFWSNLSLDENFSNEFINKKYHPIDINYSPSTSALLIEKDITSLELLSSLQTLRGCTPGLNRISYPMIRNSSCSTKNRILQLFNNIFNSHIPQTYKTSLIVPVLKPKADMTLVSSYRPISLNCCLAKVLDKIIAKRLWWYATRNRLLNAHQFGFKPGKATYDSLLYIDHVITRTLSSSKHTSLVSLDFSRAFDRVGIHTIIEELKQWKIGPKIINYIKNFMKNRKILVKVGTQTSTCRPLNNGIPQGSPISVILFLIAYNKLANIIMLHKEITFTAYADDFLLIVNPKKANIQNKLDALFEEINKWCAYSGALLSPTKCQHLHICRKRNCTFNLSFHNNQIPTTTSLKVLGLTINNKYKWNSHIQTILSSLTKKLDIIKCLTSKKFYCDTSTLLNIVKSIVVSKIDYGLFIYGYTTKNLLNKLKSKLNTAIRLALGAYRTTPIHNLLYETDIPNIELKREYLITKLFKNLLHSIDTPIYKIIKQHKPKKKTHFSYRPSYTKL